MEVNLDREQIRVRDKASEELDQIENWKLDTNIMICKEPSYAYVAIFLFFRDLIDFGGK